MLQAIRQQRWDYCFPTSTSLLVRLANILPKPVTAFILGRKLQAQRALLARAAISIASQR